MYQINTVCPMQALTCSLGIGISMLPLVLPSRTIGSNLGSSWPLIAQHSVIGVASMCVKAMLAEVPSIASIGYSTLLFVAYSIVG
ncbi:hypothetical protein APX70_03964 [Pseudomonas syringae pv. maculicola]|uniref:Uncharacterized protein n=1 Tax=Pseudomonas syringae pv. maculicola TaxID=59511 RepID=A0A3M2Z8R6_PSEYM|nr:hypothetical protein APX70_03964 [Pseudomonas syringae pv. maculicola]